MTNRWTDAQARAIALFGSDVCVPAGAGSGKTAVLVERYLHAVEKQGFKPSEILAITFTEKAAAEMRRRLLEKAKERGLESLRSEIETAPIGTIHSFCARLLRENPVECGIDPEFRIMSDTEREMTLTRVFDALMESEAGNPKAIEVLALYGEDAARSSFARLIEQGRASGQPGARPAEPDPAVLERQARSAFETALDAVSAAKSPKEWTATEARTRESAAAMRKMLSSAADWARLENLRSASKMSAASKTLKEAVGAARAAHEEWESAEAARLSAPVRREFLRLLARYEAMLEEEKKRLAAYDFDDLIEKTLEALRAGDPVRRTWAERTRGRFRAVFVDEYQDVNPAQASLVELLKSPGNGFAVGDGRQSIYGFRYADPEIFERARAGASVVALSDNFRSRPELLRFVNAFFERRFPNEQPLVPAKKYGAKNVPSIELLAVPVDPAEEGEKPLDRARVREAELLAAHLRRLVDSKFRVEPPNEAPRPVEWRDIAVLFRKGTAIRLYDRAFRDAGIPFDLPKGKGYFEKSEVVDLLSFLSTLNDPYEDIPLAAVLRSPLAGLSDDALLAIAQARPRGTPFFQALTAVRSERLPAADRARFGAFMERFARFRASRERWGISRLLEQMIEETGYRPALAAAAGPQALANVDKLIDLARECEAAGGGAADFVRLTRLLTEREEDEPEARMPADRGNAVSFLTVHSAKGLEFPVVAAADLGAKPRTDAPFFRASASGEIGLRYQAPDGGEWISDPSYRRLEADASRRALRESDRLLYVAMTRAREHLILTGAWKAPKKAVETDEEKETTWMTAVLETCGFDGPQAGEAVWKDVPLRWIDAAAAPVCAGRSAGPKKAAAPLDAEKLFERLRLPEKSYEMAEDVTVTRLVEAATKEELEALLSANKAAADLWAEEPDKDAAGRTEEDDEPAVPANRFGTVFHKLMELSMRPSLLAPLKAEEFDGWTREFAETEKADLRRQSETFWKGEWGKAVRSAGRRYPELPFIYKTKHGLLKGQIDLAFESAKDGWTILDYKTNRITEADLEKTAKRYEFQLALYAHVFAELYGQIPKKGVLYFSAIGRSYEFSYAPEAVRAVGDRLDRAHAAILAG